MNKLVSIITPCYNGASYVHRYIESVLNQTYSKMEFIFVNDGSTDETENIVLSYKQEFERKGIKFVYIRQRNGGASNAVNAGLKVFTGDYLTWPDSDDWMMPDCIEKKVKYLEEHQDVGIVACKIGIISEKNEDYIESYLTFQEYRDSWAFERLLLVDRIFTAPIGFMVRTSMLLDVIPTRHIFDKNKDGQNWQILLPIAFRYPCAYIDVHLGYYLVRENSVSHDNGTFYKSVSKERRRQEILENVLDSVDMPEVQRQYYLRKVKMHYANIRLRLAAKYNDRKLMDSEYQYLRTNGELSRNTILFYICGRCKLYNICSIVMHVWKTAKCYFKKIWRWK